MASEDVVDTEANASLFRECLFNSMLDKTGERRKHRKTRSKSLVSKNEAAPRINIGFAEATDDPSEMVDFSDFLASEVFPSLPDDLRNISYHRLQEAPALSDKWSLPLSLSTYEEIVDMVPPSVNDSLLAYGLIEPPKSDMQTFLSPAIAAYITAATIPPPKWSETKVTACEICERDWVPMTYHHLIPKAVHAKALKRGWHEERQLNSVAWLCRACHSFVHRMASNEELAKEYFTVEKICEKDEVQKWAMWVGKVRWKKT